MEELKLKSKYITLDERSRLYGLTLPIIALTGGIATGKSTVSKLLKAQGFEIIDADVLIHEIYESAETIDLVKSLSPQSIINNKISFKELRADFFTNEKLKTELEAFLYKRLPVQFEQSAMKLKNKNFIIYDIPLLFEKDLEMKFDINICVYSQEEIQLKRLISRDNSSKELAEQILKSQLPIESKKNRAQFILDNTTTIEELSSKIQLLTNQLFE